MANWRERGYVPDSDEEEDESLTKESVAGNSTHGNSQHETAASLVKLPSLSAAESTSLSGRPPASSPTHDATQQANPGVSVETHATTIQSQPHAQQELAAAAYHESLDSSAASVAEELQAILRKGLDVCRSVKSSPLLSKSSGPDSDSDSPLSSPPDSVASSPRRAASPRVVHHDPQSQVQPIQPVSTADQWQGAPLIRSFRPRTAVQLQPYTLDVAKHRTEWQARGLRPVHLHLAGEHHHHGPKRREEKSQGDETFESSPRDQPPARPSLRRIESADSLTPSRERGGEHPESGDIDDIGSDDEVPDILQVLRGGRQATVAKLSKRRLISKRPLERTMDAHTSENTPHFRDVGRSSVLDSLFDLPPSPPRSGSLTPVGLLSTSPTPRRPPTPLVSSDRIVTKRKLIEVSSSSESEGDQVDRGGESSGEESSTDEPNSLVHIRRRIRGVLPASWIRLDAQQQKGKSGKQASGRSPEKRPSKGLARQISRRPESSSGARPPVLDLSSDVEESESSQQRADLIARSETIRTLFDSDQHDAPMGEVIEDNAFDRMLPAKPRNPRTEQPRKKRQQGLIDAWSKGSERHPPANMRTTASSTHRSIDPQSRRKRHKKQARHVQMSILDAPGLVRLDHQDQPSFLRVAARSKAAGKRARPQDPGQKFFQLATEEDTTEVNDALDNWQPISRTGHKGSATDVQRRNGNPVIHRGDQNHPRQPVSRPSQQQIDFGLQIQHNHKNKAAALQVLKTSTDATLARLQHQVDRHTEELESSTAPLDPIALSKQQKGFVSWHGNRAGRGNFWHQLLSRPAQLETPAPPSTRLTITPRTQSMQTLNMMPFPKRQVPSAPQGQASLITRSRPRKQAVPQRLDPEPDKSVKTTVDSTRREIQSKHATSTSTRSQSAYIALARLALSNTSLIAKPSPKTRLQLPPMISNGQLTAIIETPISAARLSNKIPMKAADFRTPSSRLTQQWSGDPSKDLHYIRMIVDEAMDILANNASNTSIEQARQSIDAVVLFIDTTMMGLDDTERKTLIRNMTQILDSALTFLSSQAKTSTSVYNLSLLNKILLLGYQTFTATRGPGEDVEDSVLQLWTRARLLTLELLLGLPVLQQLAEVATSFESLSWPRETQVYIEGLFLWFHLTTASCPESTAQDVLRVCLVLYGDSAQAPMALFATLLPLLYPLSYSNTTGLFEDRQVRPFDPLTFLETPLHSFLDTFSNIETPNPIDIRLGLKVLKTCLFLASKGEWSGPDSLLQLLFQHYGKNGMIELFYTPNISKAVSRVAGDLSSDTDPRMTDFEIFLRLVSLTLGQKSKSLGDGSAVKGLTGRIMNLVYSLLPNKSAAVHEDERLPEENLLATSNTYALCATLFSSVPRGHRPRVAQIENLVDFTISHAQIRDLTIAAWARMSLTAVTEGSDLPELRSLQDFGVNMWSGLASKITTSLDAIILEKSYFQYNTTFANCEPVIAQMRTLITKWTMIVDSAIGIDVGDITSNIRQKVLPAIHFLQEHFEKLRTIDVDVYHQYFTRYRAYDLDISFLKLLCAIYLKESISSRVITLHSAQQIVSSMLSATDDTTARLETIVRVWFHMSKLASGDDRNRWELHLQEGAKYSFPLLATTTVSQQCEVLFLSHVVEEVPTVFELDPEELYIRWLKHILKRESQLRFEHILTNCIVTNNPGNLDLHGISNLTGQDDGSSTIKTFTDQRIDIVKHVIRAVYQLQFDVADDSQDLVELPIDQASGWRLLKLITEVLKSTWCSIPAKSDPAYTRLVTAAVKELKLYPFPNFIVDPWFTDPEKGDFISEDRFRLLFSRHVGLPARQLDEALIIRFRQDNQKACNTPNQASWIDQMVSALSTIDSNGDITEPSSMDGVLQMSFMQNALSVYIQFAFLRGSRFALWTIPVVQILIRVIRDAHLRSDLLDQPDSGLRPIQFANMCLEILIRTRQALDNLVKLPGPRRRHVMRLAIAILDLATACVSRIANLSRYDSEVTGLLEHVEPQATAIYECVTDPMFDARCGVHEHPGLHDPTMVYKPYFFKPLAVEGTEAELRRAAIDDVDVALTRGRQPLGLGESWAAWLGEGVGWEGMQTFTGWEGDLEEVKDGGEVKLRLLARAVAEFYVVGSEEAGVLERGDERWRVWEVLERVGARGPVRELSEGEWTGVVVEGLRREGEAFVPVAEQGEWKAEEFEE